MSSAYMNRARGRSLSQQPNEEELSSIEKHSEFVNMTFKYSINDLESVIAMLRARHAAEDAYLNSLYKVRKMAYTHDGDRPSLHHESQLTFQTAVKIYEATVVDTINSRQKVRDTIRLEIDNLVKLKEQEEQNRKTYKTKLTDANLNYTTFRNRDIVKLHKTYTHKCEDLKTAQNNWQQQLLQQQQQQLQQQLQQQQQQQLQLAQGQFKYSQEDNIDYYKSNRNSIDSPYQSRISGEQANRDVDSASILSFNNSSDQHNKKGVAGLLSQMRTRATGNAYMAPLDQNKQNTKVAKMKKDITEADNEYREGILELEILRRKQTKASEEVMKQLKYTIKRKTDTVKNTLSKILQSELETLKVEIEISSSAYIAATNIDSYKDIQVFTMHYQSQGYICPTPTRYENFYLEGKCKEVLFGGSLETYAIGHNKAVPLLVTKCIEAIENMGGLQKEGLYRVSGRQTNIEQLKHQFELDEDKVILDAKYDVFTIATVLKMYIRELKRPLFDFNVQTRSVYSKNLPQSQRFNLLETKLANLSLAHRSTLLCIIRHLSKVYANCSVNKMNIQNLALIFTPVIFHDFNQTEGGSFGDWSPDDLFEDLILNFEYLFPIAEENARKNNEHKLSQALNGKSPYSQFSQSNLLYLNTPAPTSNMLLTQPMNPAMLMNNNGMDSSGAPNAMDQQYNSPYPPNLTTIIGTAPPANMMNQTPQRVTSQQQQQQQTYNNGPARSIHSSSDSGSRIIPPRYQSDTSNPSYQPHTLTMNRSTSETTVMARGSSMTNTPTGNNYTYSNSSNNSPLPARMSSNEASSNLTKRNSGTLSQQQPYAPPRQDSLRKIQTRMQGENEKTYVGDQTDSPQSATPSGKQGIPPPIITTSNQQQYYQPELNQEYALSSVIENQLDTLLDYYSPVTSERSVTETKHSPSK